jgi:hypothetical protein
MKGFFNIRKRVTASLKTINFNNKSYPVFFRSKNTVDNFLRADPKIIQIKNITL